MLTRVMYMGGRSDDNLSVTDLRPGDLIATFSAKAYVLRYVETPVEGPYRLYFVGEPAPVLYNKYGAPVEVSRAQAGGRIQAVFRASPELPEQLRILLTPKPPGDVEIMCGPPQTRLGRTLQIVQYTLALFALLMVLRLSCPQLREPLVKLSVSVPDQDAELEFPDDPENTGPRWYFPLPNEPKIVRFADEKDYSPADALDPENGSGKFALRLAPNPFYPFEDEADRDRAHLFWSFEKDDRAEAWRQREAFETLLGRWSKKHKLELWRRCPDDTYPPAIGPEYVWYAGDVHDWASHTSWAEHAASMLNKKPAVLLFFPGVFRDTELKYYLQAVSAGRSRGIRIECSEWDWSAGEFDLPDIQDP